MATLGQDILTTAVEGGIGYWFQISDYKRTDDLDWVEVVGRQLNDDESGYDGDEHTIKATQLEKAAKAIIGPDFNMKQTMKDNIARMIRHRDAGEIDAYEADAIVQYATFGKLVYG